MEPIDVKTAHHSGGWVLALVLLCAGLAFYETQAEVRSWNLAFVAGETIVFAGMIWVAFHLIFLRGRGAGLSFVAFLAIFMSMLGGSALAMSKTKKGLF